MRPCVQEAEKSLCDGGAVERRSTGAGVHTLVSCFVHAAICLMRLISQAQPLNDSVCCQVCVFQTEGTVLLVTALVFMAFLAWLPHRQAALCGVQRGACHGHAIEAGVWAGGQAACSQATELDAFMHYACTHASLSHHMQQAGVRNVFNKQEESDIRSPEVFY